MTRNSFAITALLAMASITTPGCAGDTTTDAAAKPKEGSQTHQFTGRVFDESGKLVGPVTTPKVVKSPDAWRAELTPAQFHILREAGTERAGTGALLENKAAGVYGCAGCRLPLFASKAKFESGTGWPSFFEPIARENIAELADYKFGMKRVEIRCPRCDGHLGHVFDDGPAPTGLRYCLNSEAMNFTSAEKLNTLAEPAATMTKKNDTLPSNHATAVFAGGCFWCVEAVFEELDGVTDAISGYAGGSAETANYKDVCSGRTAHAEAVQIVYDPAKISYAELLQVHFATHDPTQLNRQGNDVGPQYRSALFCANVEEKAIAEAFLEDLQDQKVFGKPVVTTIEPLTEFYPAESYHQGYVCENPGQGYVRAIALPKVAKVRKLFKDKLKDQSPLDK